VATNMVKVDQREIAEAPVVHNMGLQPVRASVMGAGRPISVKPPAAVVNRPVVAIRQPAPPRAPLEQRLNAAPNIRTEAPRQAQPEQPVARTPNEAPRPGQPAVRPSEVVRPQPPTMQANQPARPQPPTMQANQPARPQPPINPANDRPAGPVNVPRPGVAQPQESPRQQELSHQPDSGRPVERSMPHPPSGDNGRPLVRPAPPVRENPQHQQNEQSKFNAWERQRQSSAPREAARPQEAPRTAQPQPRAAQPHPEPRAQAPHPGPQPPARDDKPKK
jgi:hypothetical protein